MVKTTRDLQDGIMKVRMLPADHVFTRSPDIAEQTNLLALSASIEAARAGGHSCGFENELNQQAAGVAAEMSAATEELSKPVNREERSMSEAHSMSLVSEGVFGERPAAAGRARAWGQLFFPLLGTLLALSAISLVSWIAGVKGLRVFAPGTSPMSFNSAFLFGLIFASLSQLKARNALARYVGVVSAVVVMALGALTLVEYLVGVELGIDGTRLVGDTIRMSPISAVMFLVIGLVLLLLWVSAARRIVLVQLLVLAVGLVSLFNLIGYLYSMTVFYHISPYKAISLRSSACFGLCVVAVLLHRPAEGLMGTVMEDSYGGLIIRRFLLFVLSVPVLLGGLTCLTIQKGLLSEPHAILFLVLLMIVVFTVLLFVNGRTISRTESEKTRAQGAFRKVESSYRELFENIGSAVCICGPAEDRGGLLVVDMNKAAEHLEGVRKAAAVGQELGEAVPAMRDFGVVALMQRVWETGQPEFSEHEGQAGQYRRSRIYRLPAGEVVVVYEDISEQKRSEREREALRFQLFQAQKMEAIGRLAGGIAHDFNNLLTIISGYCKLVLRRDRLRDADREDLQEIKRAAGNASGLINQLLAFSRKQALQPEVVNLNEIVNNARGMLRTLLGEGVELVLELEPRLQCVEADPAQMMQVFMNLAGNSRDAMAAGGRFTIRTRNLTVRESGDAGRGDPQPGEYVVLEVSDTGEGMDDKTLGQIFEPFFTTKKIGKGTGLGLSTVYGIITQSRGAIHPRSEPSRGTEFTIYLPAVGDAGGKYDHGMT
jgi:two-component system cell cycle sensor histidine kinase/response regulator CckA